MTKLTVGLKIQMKSFNFYDIEKLIEEGVSNDQLREIVAEANRFKVLEQGDLNKALEMKQIVTLSNGYPSKWNEELDAFVRDNLRESGRFSTGEIVLNHSAAEGACDWYKSFIGLESKVTASWITESGQRQYSIQVLWNKHLGVSPESRLVAIGNYNKPSWIREATKRSFDTLFVELEPYDCAEKLLKELSEFVKHMTDFAENRLIIKVAGKDLSFTLVYRNRLSFRLRGQRSSRSEILRALKEVDFSNLN